MHYPPNEETLPSEHRIAPPPPPESLLPPRRPPWWPWIALILLALVIGYGAGVASSWFLIPRSLPARAATQVPTQAAKVTPSPAVTPTPMKPLVWTATHKFKGKNELTTDYMMIDKDWKLLWKCDPGTITGAANAIVDSMGEDAILINVVLNTICESGSTSGEMLVHQGKRMTIYLGIQIAGEWTVEVQELR